MARQSSEFVDFVVESLQPLGPVMAKLMAAARPNADMGGNDAEGPGRPVKEI